MIGSGSLLIVCAPDAASRIEQRIQSAGIQTSRIGEVLEPESGIEAFENGRKFDWPHFGVDEIARYMSLNRAPLRGISRD